jgi:uncharacterized protein DUF4238
VGHHFTPQAALRPFQDPTVPGRIWTYPRGAPPRLAAIASVAQAPGFYDADVEADLNTYVEAPANPHLDRLRRSEFLQGDGRHRIAVYLATVLKRVPRHRARGHALVPQAIKETVAGLRADLASEFAAQSVVGPEQLQRQLAELDRIEVKYLGNPPPEVLEQIRSPWPNPELVEMIARMAWRIAVTAEPEFFITSDNPAVFFEGYGLRNPESELCFPLSPTHCLHGSHQPIAGGDLGFCQVEREIVREMNRRIASAATTLVLAHKRVMWVATLQQKRNPQLRRIAWKE